MIIGVYFAPTEVNKIKYVFHFIKNHPFSPPGVEFLFNPLQEICEYHLRYETDPILQLASSDFLIPRQNLLLNQSPDSPLPAIYAHKYTWEDQTLYSVEEKQTRLESPFFVAQRFAFDWIEMIFFHLSRLEEYCAGRAKRDDFGRLHTQNYFLVRSGLQEIPVVDQLIGCIWKAIGLKPQKPHPVINLSHDLDFPLKFSGAASIWRNLAGTIIHRRPWTEFLANYRAYRAASQDYCQDPYYTYPYLFRRSAAYHNKKVYLLAGGRRPQERPYDLTSAAVQNIIKLARVNNYDFGLHPSTLAARDEQIFSSEKKLLETVLSHPVSSSRQHYLLFLFPETLHCLQNLGIQEDSSLGFRDLVGFKCGTVFSYQLYDLVHDRASSVIEKPLIFMDSALWHQTKYQVTAFMTKMFDFIHQHRDSAMQVNFHNSFFDSTLPAQPIFKEAYLQFTEMFERP